LTGLLVKSFMTRATLNTDPNSSVEAFRDKTFFEEFKYLA